MDYRNIPGTTGHRRWLCGRCRRPLREARGQSGDLVSAAALYLLAVAIVGVPLALPGWAPWWLVVNLVLALLVGCLVAARQRAAASRECPQCEQELSPAGHKRQDSDGAHLLG
jgi:hypothetical protein